MPRRQPPKLSLLPFFANLSPSDPSWRKADRMMSDLQQEDYDNNDRGQASESMPGNVGTAQTRRGQSMTLEKLNAVNGDPSDKAMKQRIRAWQQDGGANANTDPVVTKVEKETSLPLTKGATREIPLRASSPTKSPMRKEYAVIQDEETGKVQGIKITSPIKQAKPAAPKMGATVYDPQLKAWVRRKASKPQVELESDLMHAGMPKKRVVSDSHWRKDRSPTKIESPAKEHPVPEAEPKARKIAVQKSTPNLRSKPPLQKTSPEIKSRPISTRQTASESRPFQVREAIRERPQWRSWDPSQDAGIRSRQTRLKSRSRSRERGGATSSINVERHAGAKMASPRSPVTPYTINRTTVRRTPDRKSLESEEVADREPNSSGKRRHGRRRMSSPRTSDVETEDQYSIATPLPDDSISRRGEAIKPAPLRILKSPKIGASQAQTFSRPVAKEVPMPQPKKSGNRIEDWLGGTPDPFSDTAKSSSVTTDGKDQENRHSERRSISARSTGKVGLQEQTRDQTPTKSGGRPMPRSSIYEKTEATTFVDTGIYSSRQAASVPPRKAVPTTGRPLSTIAASIATFDVRAERPKPPIVEESYGGSVISDLTARQEPQRNKSGLKRRLTKHEDLMSVLSLPRGDAPSLVSARSLRTKRTPLDNATIDNVLAELASDESKYQRELRTLVDGVIPVLLSNVLSKSNSAITANLFGPAQKSSAAVTQPIVDMGIALERLKVNHKRMPQTNPDALIKWSNTAAKVYSDYIKAWRMGFDDVIVNLAPPDSTEKKDGRWDEGLLKNENGDLVNGDGERVDVAFLLKRPLVRLKYLAKTLRGINHVKPTPEAEAAADQFQSLVVEARKKSNDERARLEDEAAASIDPTRVRDLKTMAPLAGVKIDPARCVRARDYFDLTLKHSTGQRLDCKIEIIIRDNSAGVEGSGDLLFCEESDTGRWLLFPPVMQDMVSARLGSKEGEMILLVRGLHADLSEWSEVLTLVSSEDQACEEWTHMLQGGPVPPSPTKTEFTLLPTELTEPESPSRTTITGYTESTDQDSSLLSPLPGRPAVMLKSRTPSPNEIEVPIGEQARKTSKRWSQGVGAAALSLLGQATPGLRRKQRIADPYDDDRRATSMPPESPSQRAQPYLNAHAFTDKAAARAAQDGGSPLRRSRATKHRRAPSSPGGTSTSSYLSDWDESAERSPERPHLARSPATFNSDTASTISKSDYSVWLPSTSSVVSDEEDSQDDYDDDESVVTERPGLNRRLSSVPGKDLPAVSKLRKPSPPQTSRQHRHQSEPAPDLNREGPNSASAKLQKRVPSTEKSYEEKPRAAETSPKLKTSFLPSLTPNFLKRTRRPSSPLKHEYAPTPLESDTDSETDDSEFDNNDSDSASSYTSESEDDGDHFSQALSPGLQSITSPPPETDKLGGLRSPASARAKSPLANGLKSPSLDDHLQDAKAAPPESIASLTPNTVAPSNSASQVPFRHVPQQLARATKTVANIFAWANSMQGGWEPLHPQEIRVVVTPGLIEAFDMAEAHSVPENDSEGQETSPSTHGIKPLVALELTPLVPLRRGTALDISIRSPLTGNSQIKSNANIMFRSRSPEECENLYNQINQARINNPTYIALQNARGPFSPSSFASALDRNADTSAYRSASTSSWWHLGRRKSYRASAGPRGRPVSFAASESSVGSTFSALRRFSGTEETTTSPSKRLFSIGRSTITSRKDASSSLDDTLSSGYSTPRGTSGFVGLGISGTDEETASMPLGINAVKIRLYIRESASKWRDMGSARLTILLPSRAPGSVPPVLVKEKRVLIQGTTKGETLLDVTLGESCFERVARTGIAVSVFEDGGVIRDKGGVMAGQRGVYMVQMKSERDAAYTFGLVGRHRY